MENCLDIRGQTSKQWITRDANYVFITVLIYKQPGVSILVCIWLYRLVQHQQNRLDSGH